MAKTKTFAPYAKVARAKRAYEIAQDKTDLYAWKEGEALRSAYWDVFAIDLWEPVEKQ